MSASSTGPVIQITEKDVKEELSEFHNFIQLYWRSGYQSGDEVNYKGIIALILIDGFPVDTFTQDASTQRTIKEKINKAIDDAVDALDTPPRTARASKFEKSEINTYSRDFIQYLELIRKVLKRGYINGNELSNLGKGLFSMRLHSPYIDDAIESPLDIIHDLMVATSEHIFEGKISEDPAALEYCCQLFYRTISKLREVNTNGELNFVQRFLHKLNEYIIKAGLSADGLIVVPYNGEMNTVKIQEMTIDYISKQNPVFILSLIVSATQEPRLRYESHRLFKHVAPFETAPNFYEFINQLATYGFAFKDEKNEEAHRIYLDIYEVLSLISDEVVINNYTRGRALREFLKETFGIPGIFGSLFPHLNPDPFLYNDMLGNGEIRGELNFQGLIDLDDHRDKILSQKSTDLVETRFDIRNPIVNTFSPILGKYEETDDYTKDQFPLTDILPLEATTQKIFTSEITPYFNNTIKPYEKIQDKRNASKDTIDHTNTAARVFLSLNCGYIRAKLDSIITPWNFGDEQRFNGFPVDDDDIQKTIYHDNFAVKKDALYMFFDENTYRYFKDIIDDVIKIGKYIKKVVFNECVSAISKMFFSIHLVLEEDYKENKKAYSEYITNKAAFFTVVAEYKTRPLYLFEDLIENGASIEEEDGEFTKLSGRRFLRHKLSVIFQGLDDFGWPKPNEITYTSISALLHVYANLGRTFHVDYPPDHDEFIEVDIDKYSVFANKNFMSEKPLADDSKTMRIRKSWGAILHIRIDKFLRSFGKTQAEWDTYHDNKNPLKINETQYQMLLAIEAAARRAHYSLLNQINLYFSDCYLLCREMWYNLLPTPERIAKNIFGINNEKDFVKIFNKFAKNEYQQILAEKQADQKPVRGPPAIHRTVATFEKRGAALIKKGFQIKEELDYFYEEDYISDVDKNARKIRVDLRCFHNTEKFPVFQDGGTIPFQKEDEIYMFLDDIDEKTSAQGTTTNTQDEKTPLKVPAATYVAPGSSG